MSCRYEIVRAKSSLAPNDNQSQIIGKNKRTKDNP